MIMHRQKYAELKRWQQDGSRKPLILRGARQVGKTHLLKQFGANEYEHCICLNFEEDPQLASFFQGKLSPERIIENLQIYTGEVIEPESTLLIFDEIQECPEALNSLKYFNEKHNEYHIAAAGSLLGVKLQGQQSFPVGKVNFMDLYPLTFLEFIQAVGEVKLAEYLDNLSECIAIPQAFHEELLRLLRLYYVIGGMPEVVNTYVQHQEFDKVREIQKAILAAYNFDFAKHAEPSQVMKINEIWQSIPTQLAKENKKFIFSVIRKSARAREYQEAIQWLSHAGLIHQSFRISASKLPIDAYSDKNIFKVFLLDVGLLGAMSDLPMQTVIMGDELFQEFKGALTENFVAQALVARNNHLGLYYWASEGQAEVDFVIQHVQEILPIEVKAGSSNKKKSLSVYMQKYQPQRALRVSTLNLDKQANIENYPLYLTSRIAELE